MSEENLSQTKKAKAARRWRKVTSQRKRFEGTLKEFLKVKYLNIYDEYVQFYNCLDRKCPNVRELSKSAEFKEWAREIRQEARSPPNESEDSQNEIQNHLPPVSSLDETTRELIHQQSSDVLSAAIKEVLPQGIPDQDQVLDDIEKIINDLEQECCSSNIESFCGRDIRST